MQNIYRPLKLLGPTAERFSGFFRRNNRSNKDRKQYTLTLICPVVLASKQQVSDGGIFRYPYQTISLSLFKPHGSAMSFNCLYGRHYSVSPYNLYYHCRLRFFPELQSCLERWYRLTLTEGPWSLLRTQIRLLQSAGISRTKPTFLACLAVLERYGWSKSLSCAWSHGD